LGVGKDFDFSLIFRVLHALIVMPVL